MKPKNLQQTREYKTFVEIISFSKVFFLLSMKWRDNLLN